MARLFNVPEVVSPRLLASPPTKLSSWIDSFVSRHLDGYVRYVCLADVERLTKVATPFSTAFSTVGAPSERDDVMERREALSCEVRGGTVS